MEGEIDLGNWICCDVQPISNILMKRPFNSAFQCPLPPLLFVAPHPLFTTSNTQLGPAQNFLPGSIIFCRLPLLVIFITFAFSDVASLEGSIHDVIPHHSYYFCNFRCCKEGRKKNLFQRRNNNLLARSCTSLSDKEWWEEFNILG